MADQTSDLPEGRYIRLQGDPIDRRRWERVFKSPFDPIVYRDGDELLLVSNEFEGLKDNAEVREKGLALLGRLNGAMNVLHSSKPLTFAGVTTVDEEGNKHHHAFIEVHAAEMRMDVMEATVTVRGPDGEPLPLPPPQPSDAQKWNSQALLDEDVADLLEQISRADNWYDIYKSVELMRVICGSEEKLRKMLGTAGDDFKRMRATANFYRHARGYRPPKLTPMPEAINLLRFAARQVLSS